MKSQITIMNDDWGFLWKFLCCGADSRGGEEGLKGPEGMGRAGGAGPGRTRGHARGRGGALTRKSAGPRRPPHRSPPFSGPRPSRRRFDSSRGIPRGGPQICPPSLGNFSQICCPKFLYVIKLSLTSLFCRISVQRGALPRWLNCQPPSMATLSPRVNGATSYYHQGNK